MRTKPSLLFKLTAVFAVFIAALVLTLSGCEGNRDEPVSPVSSTLAVTSGDQIALSKSDSRIIAAMRVQEKHTARLMASRDVVGTAVGLDEAGDVVVKIYTAREGVAGLPATLDGMKVDVEVTGIIHAMGKPGGGGGVSHKAKQTPPIQLGTSGGWAYDLANGYCCGGTLGSLVVIKGKQYILSNYHVFESDIVPGGNNRVAGDGDYVIQPGLIDVSCNATTAQNVATLVKSSSLPNSNVDAAIAQVISGMVRTDGSILEVGVLSASTVAAFVNQAVKKSGRTTGLTRSKITGLNGTVSVTYDNECAGGTAFTKTFTGQILVANKASKFLAGGDSGSLMIEDITTNPRAVGLLFAGSSSIAVANPIGQVLGFFGAAMVGN
ncbi:MAG: hypothetical protein H6Q31_3122 [Bacteroidetes bacterium]|jgi:hypothetical protein|nr:hypothetical protein [Bacteroidota bacterium]